MIWTLGVAAAITTIFVTFNYAQYKYVAERERAFDRATLAEDLKASLADELDSLRTQNNENFETKVQLVNSQVAAEIGRMDRQVKEFEIELQEAEFKRLSSLIGSGTLPTMDFFTGLLALQRALEIHELRETLNPSFAAVPVQDTRITQALDQLESTVDQALQQGLRSNSTTLDAMATEVDKVPAQHAASKQRVLTKLADPRLH